MQFLAILLAVVAVWIIVAVVLAVVLGRTSAAAEHNYQLSVLNREAQAMDAEADAAPPIESTPEPDPAPAATEMRRHNSTGGQL